jgi:hypothetical protein
MPTYLLTFLSSLHNNPPSYTELELCRRWRCHLESLQV